MRRFDVRAAPAVFVPALLATGVLVLLWAVFVRHSPDALDHRVYSEMRGRPGSGTARFAARLTAIGNGLPLLAVLSVLGLGARVALRSWRPPAIGLICLTVGAASSSALKDLSGRARPPRSGWLVAHAGGSSFPSGHTTTATAGYLGLAAGIAGLSRRRWTRATVWLVGALLATSIGWTRVELGVHWPSDVLAGWTIGAAVVATVTAATARWPGSGVRRRPSHSG